ncbi:hypothetical protein PR202_gb03891 [Eleusine coracana subsp. coracana]|uniref:Subtilisin n=1 Tax=Eleusine coracana subsp. coracana TaxID=191504 RepID=A0AAV5E2C3_ELECO|nr:hypothetical protein PR202_gb03891 [Eleusine coracana subsp. coracana]
MAGAAAVAESSEDDDVQSSYIVHVAAWQAPRFNATEPGVSAFRAVRRPGQRAAAADYPYASVPGPLSPSQLASSKGGSRVVIGVTDSGISTPKDRASFAPLPCTGSGCPSHPGSMVAASRHQRAMPPSTATTSSSASSSCTKATRRSSVAALIYWMRRTSHRFDTVGTHTAFIAAGCAMEDASDPSSSTPRAELSA